jgi:hypothetical protein
MLGVLISDNRRNPAQNVRTKSQNPPEYSQEKSNNDLQDHCGLALGTL